MIRKKAVHTLAVWLMPVMMGTDKVGEYARQYAIDEIIVAIATPQGDLTKLIQQCIETGCKVRVFSTPTDGNSVLHGKVRDVDIGDLLGRAENHLDASG